MNKRTKEVDSRVGDPVLYKINLREGKLEQMWEPYYRIVEQTGPVSFVICKQMAGRVKRAHADDLRLTEVDNWGGTKPINRKGRMRKEILVEPEEMETYEDSGEEEGR